jgi:hypothetical protein
MSIRLNWRLLLGQFFTIVVGVMVLCGQIRCGQLVPTQRSRSSTSSPS